jgi:putative spermidine/putrescine transport system substrate-binding protein
MPQFYNQKEIVIMKKLMIALFISIAVAGFAFASAQAEEEASADMPYAGQELIVSAWGFNLDLIEANIVQPFEEMYGVDVVFETGNNSERFTRMVARRDNPQVDVALFAGNWALNASQEGLLQPYDPSKLSNLDDLYEIAQDPLGDRTVVGYTVQNLGIVYRTDEVDPISSWADLARPELEGFLSVPGITTTYGPTLIYMFGAAFGDGYDDHEAGWAALEQMAGSVTTAYGRSSELTTLIAQEEVYAAPYTSFAWGSIAGTGLPVAKAIPEEGLPGAFSTIGIAHGADNVDLAHLYIDHMLSYEVQMAQAMDLVDSPARPDVVVPADIAEQLTYGEELISQLHFFDLQEISDNQDEWIARWNEIFSE